MKRKESRREHNPVVAKSKETAELAARLAPLEEQAGKRAALRSRNNGGAIVVDTADLKLPKDFTEREEGKERFLSFDPIAFVILIFSLAFIIFIAYLISIEPPKDKKEPRPAAEAAQ
ncbi:MAG TPA: hypothetical protein VF791_01380 [Pyrinomonadaceae bacterium]